MNILVTAGNTQVPIDRVRCITNIFTGRTGAKIAMEAYQRRHLVTLLTSEPDVLNKLGLERPLPSKDWEVKEYQTFDDLQATMAKEITSGKYHCVIHSAAVSDYLAAGVYAPAKGTHFDAATHTWHGFPSELQYRTAGKIQSSDEELWLRLVRAPKLIDMVRSDWRFSGILVKFKLEVDVSMEELLQIAKRSRGQSNADLMVANTLEGVNEWALIGSVQDKYECVQRKELPRRLMEIIEEANQSRARSAAE